MDRDIQDVLSKLDCLGTTWVNDWGAVQKFQAQATELLEELQARRRAHAGRAAWQNHTEHGLFYCYTCWRRFNRLVGENLCEDCWNEKHPEKSGHFTISRGLLDEWVPDKR